MSEEFTKISLEEVANEKIELIDERWQFQPATLTPTHWTPLTLQGLPRGVLIKIATYLNITNKACLAFTCQILCETCSKFHLPRRDRTWNKYEGPRRCIQYGNGRALEYLESPYLPRQVHFDIVAAITRSYRFDSGLYDTNSFFSTEKYTAGRAKITSNVSARLYKGSIVLKAELVLSAGKVAFASENVDKLEKMLQKSTKLENVCQHVKWAEVLPFIFRPQLPTVQKSGQSCLGKHSSQKCKISRQDLHTCLWTHSQKCWSRCDAYSRLGSDLQRLWSCNLCSTDYKISLSRKQGKSSETNSLVFTSWKNLGRCTSVYNEDWAGHMNPGLSDYQKRGTDLYDVARSFENPAKGLFDFEYYPSV
ncbi:uncharacterized protein NECHADRAFT_83278 [Fusarium vanettenii 77-13-4]|uniref:F-box domain-containing protein n=1 Tax=Fusarium vanettenii (strain ATCC MYA-4622 / CBS 123669 / FGSC 9596 / NRRL 45880 / 77-13-4) TaxID=660122 RepID=C7Z3K2_FUSV7|nr:uncharacterized protein NECHADRAFT_83278 [Fusarium vanettenii 77-13-4]EEU41150.1 predicted protein [Fusarium vanettenii 77-13-4]